MNIVRVLALLAPASLSLSTICDNHNNLITGHTVFTTRAHFQSSSPEYVSSFRPSMQSDEPHVHALQATLFGSKSTHNNELGIYFGPNTKHTLVARNFVNPITGVFEGDLDVQHFNVSTVNQFESSVALEAQQSVIGVGLTIRHHLVNPCCTQAQDSRWWVEISTPLMRVQNTVILNEQITGNPGAITPATGLAFGQKLFGSVKQAFNQEGWDYGKIDAENPRHHKTGLADIELKVGYEWLNSACCGLESYAGIIIPTGNKPRAEFVFEPMVGNGKHTGIILGANGYSIMMEGQRADLYFCCDANISYLFSKQEKRSFDLHHKPWSRYMSVYTSVGQAQQAAALIATNLTAAVLLASSGINTFTQDMHVTPGFSATVNSALCLQGACWGVECGYNLFTRQTEHVRLAHAFSTTIALKDQNGQGLANRRRTIGDPVNEVNALSAFSVALYNQNTIQESDINLASAAHPALVNHTLYTTIDYHWNTTCVPVFVGCGGSYEWGNQNSTLRRWTLWAKGGITF